MSLTTDFVINSVGTDCTHLHEIVPETSCKQLAPRGSGRRPLCERQPGTLRGPPLRRASLLPAPALPLPLHPCRITLAPAQGPSTPPNAPLAGLSLAPPLRRRKGAHSPAKPPMITRCLCRSAAVPAGHAAPYERDIERAAWNGYDRSKSWGINRETPGDGL